MSTKQPIAVITIELLHATLALTAAVERRLARTLRTAYRAANICASCDARIDECGPVLWSRGKMCCAHCSHVRPLNEQTTVHS